MMVAAVDGVEREIFERIVHPAHVPLEAEAEPAQEDRAADARPRGGFLGDHHDAGVEAVHVLVELLDERDRVEVLAAAEYVGNPFALAARVVEVDHRGDGVNAQAVGMEFAQPVKRAGGQEIAHLGAAVVEDVGAPFGMIALARIGVLEERGAVEAAEAEFVLGKMRRHPVEDHADAAPMQFVDQIAQVVGTAVARGRRKVAADLVAPRAGERMLHHGQQLDMGEAHAASRSRRASAQSRDTSASDCLPPARAARSRDGPRRSRPGLLIHSRRARCAIQSASWNW